MTTIVATPFSMNTMRKHLRGVPVTGPGEPGWDVARQAYNTSIDQRPALIATPLDADDVAAVIRFAAEAGLRVAPQRTGHNAAPLGDLSDVVLLRTDQLQGVSIDAANRTARVRSGAKWENVVPRASELGLAALHGSTPDVSVVGYSLGGGMGWYARKHGLAANSVTSGELVTADGVLRRVDRDHEPELFWALRGPGSDSPLASVELRHLGGALGRTAAHHGAVATLPGSFAMFAVGVTPHEEAATAVEHQIELVTDAIRPYEAGHYSNFTEDDGSAARFFPDGTYARLQAVKTAYDPDGLFRANQEIAPA